MCIRDRASGEGLDSPVPTRGTALLQHGFKEWGAAVGVSTVGRDEVWPTVQHCEEQNLMPVLLCRDVAAPLEVLQHMLAQGSCALLALGSPTGLSLAPRNPDLAGSVFPLRVTSGIDLGLCMWLGAPDGLPPVSYTHLDVYKRQALLHLIAAVAANIGRQRRRRRRADMHAGPSFLAAIGCAQAQAVGLKLKFDADGQSHAVDGQRLHDTGAGHAQHAILEIDADVYKRQPQLILDGLGQR